jgi:integrase
MGADCICEALPALLRAIDGSSAIGDRQSSLALWLLCLTFVRTWELIGAEWGEIRDLDGDAPTWEIPAEPMKMKQSRVVPLSHQAVAILQELRQIGTGSRYILPYTCVQPFSPTMYGTGPTIAGGPCTLPARLATHLFPRAPSCGRSP